MSGLDSLGYMVEQSLIIEVCAMYNRVILLQSKWCS